MSRRSKRGYPRSPTASNLALDINLLEGSLSSSFEEASSLAGEYHHFALAVFKESLTAMITYESCALVIRFEAKFFSEEAKLYGRFVSAEIVSDGLSKESMKHTISIYLTRQPGARGRRTCP